MSNNKIAGVWTAHLLKEEERIAFKEQVINDLRRESFERLRAHLINEYNQREIVRRKDYDNPSWSHNQAHDNGYKECLYDIINMIKIKEDK